MTATTKPTTRFRCCKRSSQLTISVTPRRACVLVIPVGGPGQSSQPPRTGADVTEDHWVLVGGSHCQFGACRSLSSEQDSCTRFGNARRRVGACASKLTA